MKTKVSIMFYTKKEHRSDKKTCISSEYEFLTNGKKYKIRSQQGFLVEIKLDNKKIGLVREDVFK